MGYVHRWKVELDTEFLPDPFLNDVKEVVIDFLTILKDVNVSKEIVRFDGQQGHCCDTFFFRPDHYHNRVKTGGFWVEPYDKPVCAVLLLAIYHFGDKIEIHSDGLATLYVNTETKKAAPEWESAIIYVEERFGYFLTVLSIETNTARFILSWNRFKTGKEYRKKKRRRLDVKDSFGYFSNLVGDISLCIEADIR